MDLLRRIGRGEEGSFIFFFEERGFRGVFLRVFKEGTLDVDLDGSDQSLLWLGDDAKEMRVSSSERVGFKGGEINSVREALDD